MVAPGGAQQGFVVYGIIAMYGEDKLGVAMSGRVKSGNAMCCAVRVSEHLPERFDITSIVPYKYW